MPDYYDESVTKRQNTALCFADSELDCPSKSAVYYSIYYNTYVLSICYDFPTNSVHSGRGILKGYNKLQHRFRE